jgi:hypothetical protein
MLCNVAYWPKADILIAWAKVPAVSFVGAAEQRK